MNQLFGYISGILVILSFVPYIKDIFKNTTKPERASWLIWAILGLVIFFAQLAKGASNSLWFTGAQVLGDLTVFILAIKYGVGGLIKRDIIALFAAGLGLVLWYLTSEAAVALFIAIAIDATGLFLTVVKSYEKPSTETMSAWVLTGLAGLFAIFSVGKINLSLLAWPVYIFLAGLVVVIAIMLGLKCKQYKIKHIIIFSHGFGVRKDDRGLLDDLASAFPEAESILFDYFIVDEASHTLTITPLSEQVKMLNKVISKARADNPKAVIDLIGHSQGTVIAALAKPTGIRKSIMTAPVFDMRIERTIERHTKNPGSEINLNGISKLRPLDGYTRIVPAEYWSERKNLPSTFSLYNEFAKRTELIMINANQDDIIGNADLTELSSDIKVINLDGNHGFYDAARANLKLKIKELLN